MMTTTPKHCIVFTKKDCFFLVKNIVYTTIQVVDKG